MTIRCEYDGKHIVPTRPDLLEIYKQGLKPGDVIAMDLCKWADVRNRGQQGLLHSLIGEYARFNRVSVEAVKIRWKVDLGYYLPADKMLSGDIAFPSWRGMFYDLHKVYPEFYTELSIIFLRSEASYTKPMEAEFINYAIAQCEVDDIPIDKYLQGEL
jgi:hypothetical protein